VTQISPDGAADLSLIRALRPPVLAPSPEVAPRHTHDQPEVRPLRSLGSAANSSAGTGQFSRQDAVAVLTRTDGFAAGDHAVLPALRQLLRDSLAGAGPLPDVAERLIDQLTALLPPESQAGQPTGLPEGRPTVTDPSQHGPPGPPALRPFLPAATGAPMAPGPQPILITTPPPNAPDGAAPQPADGFLTVMPPQRQAVAPPAGFAAGLGAPAPPVHLENLSTVFAPPVHPPNLPAAPSAPGGSRLHESLPAPAGPPIIAFAAKTAPPTMRDLRILLAGDPLVRREQVGQALSWLLDNLDRPQVVAATCADLGPALQQVGASAQRLDAMGVLVADALRATVGGAWRQEHYDAWHSSARLVTSWMGQGMARVDYEPAFWTATVVGHERRGDDGAVVSVRTYLPYGFAPGQFATVESARHPQVWHPYWIASLPSDDNTVAIEVRATPDDAVADALVNATEVGDRVRLRPALGDLALDSGSARDLLLIAHGTGIAPMKALLADLRPTREARSVHLLWTADRDRGDIEEIRELARPGATLARLDDRAHLAAAVTGGDWTGYDVYVTGSPDDVRDTVAVLADARVPAERIHQGALGTG